eukprot:6850934-Heterocapsa_arctica.AAC.1
MNHEQKDRDGMTKGQSWKMTRDNVECIKGRSRLEENLNREHKDKNSLNTGKACNITRDNADLNQDKKMTRENKYLNQDRHITEGINICR